ncbi:MAG: toll/interleukin-1 receptor domain-containing protein [Anaerolineae bacterium]
MASLSEKQPHIFISHASQQMDYALRFANFLQQSGFSVWVDKNGIESGDDWWDTIEQALTECAIFTVLMTPEAKDSKWVKRETLLAEKLNKPTFPLLLSGEGWSRYADIQYTDIRDGNMPSSVFIAKLAEFITPLSHAGADVTPFVFHPPNLAFIKGETPFLRSGVSGALREVSANLFGALVVIAVIVAFIVVPGFFVGSGGDLPVAVGYFGFLLIGILVLDLPKAVRRLRTERRFMHRSKILPGEVVWCWENVKQGKLRKSYTLGVRYRFVSPLSGSEIVGQETLESNTSRGEPLPQPGTPARVVYLDDKNFKLI